MTEDELLETFGLPLHASDAAAVRTILLSEIEKRKGNTDAGNLDVLKLCCVQLFSLGELQDILVIWKCKNLDANACFEIEVQLLCAAGWQKTKLFLVNSNAPDAKVALEYIVKCEMADEFLDFSPSTFLENYLKYYGLN